MVFLPDGQDLLAGACAQRVGAEMESQAFGRKTPEAFAVSGIALQAVADGLHDGRVRRGLGLRFGFCGFFCGGCFCVIAGGLFGIFFRLFRSGRFRFCLRRRRAEPFIYFRLFAAKLFCQQVREKLLIGHDRA